MTVFSEPIDHKRPLKVIVIGAGISGILAALRFPRRIPNLELVVYDKNPEVGGTWYENHYPGVACDIPAHVYQASFEPNPNWTQFYAKGGEILEYWKSIVAKYDLRKYMKLGHKIVEAAFDETTSQWRVAVEDIATGAISHDSCDLLYACIGSLNDWKWPEIPGINTFNGTLLHSAAWDDTWDATDKTVAVIGSGSSAIQIVPAIQKKVKHLDNYVRGQAWIAPPIAEAEVRKHTLTESNFNFTQEELDEFNKHPETLLAYRKRLDSEIQSMTRITHRGAMAEQAAEIFTTNMATKLAKKPEILKLLKPTFMPGCRRITPGPGYLEALTEDNVSFVSSAISEIKPEGIITADGKMHPCDTIVCATGFDTSWTKRFPIYGVGHQALADKWASYPATYLSLATDGFPNLFIAHGPSGGLGVGSVSIVLERTADYLCAVLDKMQSDRIATITPKRAAVSSFVGFCKDYFSRTVFTLPCRSWYKSGTIDGPVSALWPGSALHFVKTLEHPRFEDYEYTYVGGNPVAWLGNGFTECEDDMKSDKSKYLDPENIDYPAIETLA
ncbi:uncharacterized protein V1518DRAFT_435533 [Limtongia smithiae]|uniref:uncharacterized protein n=1 Tax=Limtongia smithiae TaxID=1125753 RepID=UPI0034D00B64